jgi:protein-L-isoaspartate(D-aspartate) O-methyltransferase
LRGLAALALVVVACSGGSNGGGASAKSPGRPPASDPFAKARERMVETQLRARDIDDARVLRAMRAVPRHQFVPQRLRDRAYDDTPLPIEAEQTISQPYIVALMTQLAAIAPGDEVLEIGTGSGYQAAVLAALGARVFSIEIVEQLAKSAETRLRALGYAVTLRHGDGYAGWPSEAPFDAILVTAAPPVVPEPLKQQLAVGGRLVVPVGEAYQELLLITRTDQGYRERRVLPVRFVPMTGEAQDRGRAAP